MMLIFDQRVPAVRQTLNLPAWTLVDDRDRLTAEATGMIMGRYGVPFQKPADT